MPNFLPRHLFVLAVTLVAVTGCTAESGNAVGPTASPSNSAGAPSPTPSSTPSPSSSSPALDVADPSTWLITFEGIGPLVVGDPLGTVRQSMVAAFAPVEGGGCASWDVSPDFSAVVPNPGDESAPVAFAAILAGIPVTTSENTPKTAAGIGIGSTTAEVMAAYPDATEQENSYGPNLSITDNEGMYIDFTLGEGGVVDNVVVIDTPIAPDEYCG